MENRITFRIKNELSEQLNSYCSENKLSITDALNIAVKKLITDKNNSSDKVIDEIYKVVCNHILLYRNFTIKNPDSEIDAALDKIAADSEIQLEKIKAQVR